MLWLNVLATLYAVSQFVIMQQVVLSHPAGVKALAAGRIIIIQNKRYKTNILGAVLSTSGSSNDRKVKTLILCNPERNKDSSANGKDSLTKDSLPSSGKEADLHVAPLLKESLWKPEGECSHTVEDLTSDDILGITTETMKLDARKIEDNFSKRQIPRFR